MKFVIYQTNQAKHTSWNEVLQNSEIRSVIYIERVNELRQLVKAQKVDVLFFELCDRNLVGLSLVEEIIKANPQIKVIFISSIPDYAVTAFDLEVFDYLMLPISEERLTETIARLMKTFNRVKKKEIDPLHIKVINHLSLQKEEQKIDIHWTVLKAKELFSFLLLHKNKSVLKVDILASVWNKKDATHKDMQLLYTTMHQLRKGIERLSEHLEIVSNREGYSLLTKNCELDIDIWESAVYRYQTVTKENVRILDDTMCMNEAKFLAHEDYEWAHSEQERLEQLWLVKVIALVEYYMDSNMYEESVDWLQKIITRHPNCQKANRLLAEIHDPAKT